MIARNVRQARCLTSWRCVGPGWEDSVGWLPLVLAEGRDSMGALLLRALMINSG